MKRKSRRNVEGKGDEKEEEEEHAGGGGGRVGRN